MKLDYGKELLRILRLQRQSFVRTTDNKKIITNPVLYQQCEDEALRLQQIIGKMAKKRITAECQERGILIPDFKNEGHNKNPELLKPNGDSNNS